MAAVTNTTELMRMLNKGQDELKRSMHALSGINKCDGKKSLFKVHPTSLKPTRKRARTQQLAADQLVSPTQPVTLSPSGQATPPRKRPPRRHSSTPKVKTSVQEPQRTPNSKPFKDVSLEEAVFSNHASSRKKKRVLIDSSNNKTPNQSFNKTQKLSLRKSPKEKLTEALNASQYGALECTLPLTRSLRKSHKFQGVDPTLGYDWIAGVLDTSSYISQCSDEYFDELKEFRRANREECCRTTSLIGMADVANAETTTSTSSKIDEIAKQDVTTGVPSYVLNNRLFPVPIHSKEEPESYCPVCEHKDDHDVMPTGYIRVSVPRSTTQPVYKLRPHRRKSFDPDDSLSLSKHCLVGWENAKPSSIPTPASLNLKSVLMSDMVNPLRRHTNYLLNSTHATQYNLRSKNNTMTK